MAAHDSYIPAYHTDPDWNDGDYILDIDDAELIVVGGVTRDTFKALDSNGYISTLEIGGKVNKVKAIKGTKKVPIHGAFGSCFLDGYLYFNDLNGLKRCPLDKP